MFTCLLETLHCLPSRAVAWLLHFFSSLLSRYSERRSIIAHTFPSTLYRRTDFILKKLSLPSVNRYVVCQVCSSLHSYNACYEQRGSVIYIKVCPECEKERKTVYLLTTRTGNKKHYPYCVYPFVSLISSLQSLLLRPDFYELCEMWRCNQRDHLNISDVYDGRIWKKFLNEKGFFSSQHSIGLMLNIDWFQPYKHRIYSIGVIYLALMNLPRHIRFKRKNIIIVGLIPGPKEPSKIINSYLFPLVCELNSLWDHLKPIVPVLTYFVVLCYV